MAAVGSLPVIWSEAASENYRKYFVPACLFVMNAGLSTAGCILYVGHIDLFPIVFSTTSMGIVNVIARFVTIFSSEVAEIDEPFPEILFTSLCAISAIVAIFIRKKTERFY